jgi:glycerate-2-kinase
MRRERTSRVTSGTKRLRSDAIAIWNAGVAAVDSTRLVRECLQGTDECLVVAGHRFGLPLTGRIIVVGAGKAGAGMAAGVEQALVATAAFDRLSGWINVPADCVRPLSRIHLHAARPAAINEPTQAGVQGSEEILRIVSALSPDDVCLVLLSGGGSALLPAPVPGVSLADKQAVTRFLMANGATIEELNCVRKHLSRIKGGKLAQAARTQRLISLIISDVVGDPLDVIASGPTVPDRTTAADALVVLEKFAINNASIPDSVWHVLKQEAASPAREPLATDVLNVVIGNNDTALRASAKKASALGYRVRSLGSENRGIAKDVGRELAALCQSVRGLSTRDTPEGLPGPVCVLSGGEPTVRLTQSGSPGKGGRNQELVLAAVAEMWDDAMERIAILSGGTDGEDGPTDAAGAIADADLIARAHGLNLSPLEFLANNNSYVFFDQTNGLIRTGPTHTNVMDVRVALIDVEERGASAP